MNDRVGVLTGAGSVDSVPPPGNLNQFALENPFTIPPPVTQNSSVLEQTTLRLNSRAYPGGSNAAFFAFDHGTAFNIFGNGNPGLVLGWNLDVVSGSTISGTMQVRLASGTTFAPIGSFGDLYWGLDSHLGPPRVIGTWAVVTPAAETSFKWAMGTSGSIIGILGDLAPAIAASAPLIAAIGAVCPPCAPAALIAAEAALVVGALAPSIEFVGLALDAIAADPPPVPGQSAATGLLAFFENSTDFLDELQKVLLMHSSDIDSDILASLIINIGAVRSGFGSAAEALSELPPDTLTELNGLIPQSFFGDVAGAHHDLVRAEVVTAEPATVALLIVAGLALLTLTSLKARVWITRR